MRILILFNNSHRVDGRVCKQCLTLTQNGHQVTVIARDDNKQPTEEVICGALVKRIIRLPRLKLPIIKQIFLSIAWIKAALAHDWDAIMATNADTIDEAAFCSIWRRKPMAYDARELWLDIASMPHHPFVKAYWYIREWLGIQRAKLVISANEERRQIMKKRYPMVSQDGVIENFPDSTLGTNPNYEQDRIEFRKRLGIPEDRIVFVFQGSLNRFRGLENLAQAIPFIKSIDKLWFLIVGNGTYKDEFQSELKKLGIQNVTFTGRVDYLELPKYLSAGDVGLLFYPLTCLNYVYAAPNKLYEYMLNRLAVLANTVPTVKRVVEDEKCGFVTADEKPETLAALIDSACSYPENIALMRQRGYEAALAKYTWDIQAPKWLDMITHMA
ncbi:MAG: glycosyltransferase family 4 protein [Patescibacteria group bacterium]|nr:glycosyltransferase family 4 protein [Patescibacteria group bacterium]